MKYVIVRIKRFNIYRYIPFIFAEQIVHSEAAKRFVHLVSFQYNDLAEVFSAGFCHIHNNEFQVEHGSESLRIEKDPRRGFVDHKILNLPRAMQGMLPPDLELPINLEKR